MIALGADHGGFYLKEAVKKYLEDNNIEYIDHGCYSEESVDYAIYAKKVADDVAKRTSVASTLKASSTRRNSMASSAAPAPV